MKLKKRVLLIMLILITASLSPVSSTGLAEAVAAKLPKPDVRRPAPDFTLFDLDGNEVHLSDYRGSAVLMGFWTTW